MAGTSTIEWTDATWNPVTGCDRVSPGCAHCYALDLAARLKRMGQPRYQRDGDPRTSGPGFGVTLHEDLLELPLRWRRPRMVFANSMSDLFHEAVPFDFVRQVVDVMAEADQHIFQVLTKRPERIQDFFDSERAGEGYYAFPDNVWIGVSIENRRFVQRADILRDVGAGARFISAEPLLGPLLNERTLPEVDGLVRAWRWEDDYVGPSLNLDYIDWLIVGGESGPRHRSIDEWWVRELRDEAERTGTAFFFKQWGGRTPKAGGRELDERTWDEMPQFVGGGLDESPRRPAGAGSLT